MPMDYYEILSIVIVVQLLLFILFLLSTGIGKNQSNTILLVFLVSQCIVVLNIFLVSPSNTALSAKYPFLLNTGVPFTFLWAPTLYFYTRSLSFKDFRIRKMHLLHLIPFVLMGLTVLLKYHSKSLPEMRQMSVSGGIFSHAQLLFVNGARHLQILIYLTASLSILKKYRRALKEHFSSIDRISLSWLSLILWGYCLAWSADVIRYLFLLLEGRNSIVLFRFVLTLFFMFFNVIYFKGFQQPHIFTGIAAAEDRPYKTSLLSEDKKNAYAEKVSQYMESARPYLEPGLTLNDLSAALSIPSRYLSQVINESFQCSFYDYVNNYRVEAFKEQMTSSRKTILEALYEVGFNSKSAFNRAFKKKYGITPTEFFRSRQNR